jgi:hypothetical protein
MTGLNMSNSADRNRSEIITLATPRGSIDVMHQEMKGLRKSSGWRLFWLARRSGTQNWAQATTAQEAIRKAALLSAGRSPAWLARVAAEASHRLGEQGQTGA